MIKIEQLLPLLKSGWVAMDYNYDWWWFSNKPIIDKDLLQWQNFSNISEKIGEFDILPADNWENSLMKCGEE